MAADPSKVLWDLSLDLSSMAMGEIRLAIVGCGAVAEHVHLPVASASDAVTVTTLVDPSISRARRLADLFSVPEVRPDHRDLVDEVDAVIVATPHHRHAEISSDLLGQGIHCLVEKPMALSSVEARQMVRIASSSGAILAVGLLRRLYPSSEYVKDLLREGLLGDLLEFRMQEGYVYGWQVASASGFRRDEGGGVLADLGSHVLDLMLFWLEGVDVTAYKDDAMGGVEADCVIQVGRRDGVRGTVELSRSRRLANSYVFAGDRATLRVAADAGNSNPAMSLMLNDKLLTGHVGTPHTRWLDVVNEQLNRFVAAIHGAAEPAVSGADGLRVIEFMEKCRVLRQPWVDPWMMPDPDSNPTAR